jgi:predicted RNA-binding protein with TRAM domain
MTHTKNRLKQKGEYETRRIHGKAKRCPVEIGDELEVNIYDICPNGDGMSKIQGYIIQVPKAKPRERLKIKITKVDQKAATGEIIN